eukprot:3849800-Amphidinium_carterae.1
MMQCPSYDEDVHVRWFCPMPTRVSNTAIVPDKSYNNLCTAYCPLTLEQKYVQNKGFHALIHGLPTRVFGNCSCPRFCQGGHGTATQRMNKHTSKLLRKPMEGFEQYCCDRRVTPQEHDQNLPMRLWVAKLFRMVSREQPVLMRIAMAGARA